jgi:hypothetical protein
MHVAASATAALAHRLATATAAMIACGRRLVIATAVCECRPARQTERERCQGDELTHGVFS